MPPLLREQLIQLGHAIEELGFVRLEAASPRVRVAAIRAQSVLMMQRLHLLIELDALGSTQLDERRIGAGIAEEFRDLLLRAARNDGLGPDIKRWLDEATAGIRDVVCSRRAPK